MLTIKKIVGNRGSGLFLFGRTIAELPFIEADGEVRWRSQEAADYLLWPFISRVSDSFSLVGLYLRQRIEARMAPVPDGLRVTTVSHVVMETPFGTLPIRRLPNGELFFNRLGGLVLARSG